LKLKFINRVQCACLKANISICTSIFFIKRTHTHRYT
jgi:uncharacterized protein (DUF2132 family)